MIIKIKHLIALLALWITSIAIRWEGIHDGAAAQGVEASWHAMLTTEALRELPPHDHHFLPVVTLGGDHNRGYPWGMAVPMDNGVFVYTSFTPPAFLLSWLWFSTTNLELSLKGLALLNFILQGLSALFLFKLLLHFGDRLKIPEIRNARIALIGTAIMFFSREALVSHGIVYWSQSVYQPLMLATLWVAARSLACIEDGKEITLIKKLILAGLAFLGAWTEWTGFVTNGGIALVFWFWRKESRVSESRTLAVAVVAGTIAAGILILAHLLISLPPGSVIEVLARRAGSRSALRAKFNYLEQVALSFGPFIIAAAWLPLWRFWSTQGKNTKSSSSVQAPRDAIALIVMASIPSLENLLLLQHATEFSFDRVKLAVPISLTIAYSIALLNNSRSRRIMAAMILLASLASVGIYLREQSEYRFWNVIHSSNIEIRDQASEVTDIRTARISTNGGVRGYLNLLFNRSIEEGGSLESEKERTNKPRVFVETESSTLTDLPRITSITIFNSGEVVTIRADAGSSVLKKK